MCGWFRRRICGTSRFVSGGARKASRESRGTWNDASQRRDGPDITAIAGYGSGKASRASCRCTRSGGSRGTAPCSAVPARLPRAVQHTIQCSTLQKGARHASLLGNITSNCGAVSHATRCPYAAQWRQHGFRWIWSRLHSRSRRWCRNCWRCRRLDACASGGRPGSSLGVGRAARGRAEVRHGDVRPTLLVRLAPSCIPARLCSSGLRAPL